MTYRHILALLAVLLTAGTQARNVSPTEWQADIRQLVALITSEHPDPFTRIEKDQFLARAQGLLDDVESKSDDRITVDMMRLAASIRDGHTTLHPTGKAEFRYWFPLSFYWFEDGVYVVAAHRDQAALIGDQVLEIGGTSVEIVVESVTSLMGADNASGRKQNVFYLGSGNALKALGFIADQRELPLRLRDRAGRIHAIVVDAVETDFLLDETRFWGEMYGPLDRETLREFTVPFQSMTLPEYVRADEAARGVLPLHVRNRTAYWSTHLGDHDTYYMQLNHITASGRGEHESFESFYRSAFADVEKLQPARIVLDLRYNSGGDGSILIPFVHQFIRSDVANQPGRLYTLVGRKTYSAAVMLLDLMLKHTPTIVVGEPPGAALNAYGDPRSYALEHSGMKLDLSSEYWKLVHTSQSPLETVIDVPAVFQSNQYFEGRDPAMDFVLGQAGPFRSLTEVLLTDGAELAHERYQSEKARYGNYPWWRPFDESGFRKAARQLANAGRIRQGMTGFQILVDAYPESWRAWRDYAKATMKSGEPATALDYLLKAQAINGGDPEINRLIEDLKTPSP